MITAVFCLIAWLIAVMLYQTHKPLPPMISYESPVYRTDRVDFWTDLTYPLPSGKIRHESRILDRMLHIVDEAEQFLVIDLFLFNDYTHKNQQFPSVSARLADHLIAKKRSHPAMDIVFITDEVNTNYRSAPNELLERMKRAGIRIIQTDVDPLRDSTPVYSAVWRTFFQWFGQEGHGWLPNLMADQGPKMTLRSYLKLMNVKANHRKVLASEKSALISSGNVHDASVYHSNIALEVSGPVIGDVLKTEQAVLNFSGGGRLPAYHSPAVHDSRQGRYTLSYLTEGKVYARVLEAINGSQAGDTIDMGMFYLADRAVLDALKNASLRGVRIRLLLDPNQNAFGQEKIGIPNRPVAAELNKETGGDIKIRWYNTTEEQYHTKLLYIDKANEDDIVFGGSSNFTPRNLDDYNLESMLKVTAPPDSPLALEVRQYFDRLWENKDAEYSLDLSAYRDNTTFVKGILYRLQDILGLTTF
ncbi:phospholipase D family protein [Paenibacillus terreus]|uniref:phospholipase D n=1 Tax=Paenibacillus terreus TaxID=1387834 RepID=A0ABV5B8S1_9BACL